MCCFATWHKQDDHGNALTNEELWEDVHDVMGAGHETTATTMTASLFLISQHPHVLAQVMLVNKALKHASLLLVVA